MGGVDGIVFTAGIGENAPAIREAEAKRLCVARIQFDPDANAMGDRLISPEELRIAWYVICTDEELMIVWHTFAS